MKILLGYPPIALHKGIPLLSQNRQFQYFKEPTFIYPVVPAQAATLLKEAGHEVIWLDAIAQNLPYADFLEFVRRENPDVVAFETKTPVVKEHWKIIDDIKSNSYGTLSLKAISSAQQESVPLVMAQQETVPPCAGTVPKVVLFGDHVTALPEESFHNSQVDFILTGGDYDFLLLNLCNYLSKKGLSPQELPNKLIKGTVPKTEELALGIYYRQDGQIKNTGRFRLNHDLNSLPFIDRDLTKWQLYAFENGNYKRTPATYIMSARDCWWGKCTFCSWPTLYPEFRTRSTANVLDEIGALIENFKVREIMDDSGCFPVGDWLKSFCQGMIGRGYNKRVYFDCNMRFGALNAEDFKLMKKANFRLLLFGLESANQATLDRLNKGLKVERIIEDCKLATKAGLFPHITIMFGYPWENYADALKTLQLGHWLLKKGLAYTMQATVVIPYPGSRLFQECLENTWLLTEDWSGFDMKRPVMRAPLSEKEIMHLVQSMYKVSFHPEFIFRKFFSLRDADDLKYYLRAAKKVLGHIFDFSKKTPS